MVRGILAVNPLIHTACPHEMPVAVVLVLLVEVVKRFKLMFQNQ